MSPTTATGLKPYPAYKESGIPWLGNVPIHWRVAEAKHLYEIQMGKMLQPQATRSTDIEVPYLKAVNVQWYSVRADSAETMWASRHEIEQLELRPGDLLVCEGGEGGRAGIVQAIPKGFIIQNALHRVRPRGRGCNEFLQHLMRVVSDTGWFEAINNKATIAHFTKEKFAALPIPTPPTKEQAAIVRYLDDAGQRIQAYLSAKERLIALLEEERQAVIHQAVTRGIDPNVKLKPSGVEWLGNVPEQWKVLRAKYLFREADTRSATGEETHLSMSQKLGLVPSHLVDQSMISDSYAGGKVCEKGDLVLNRLKAHLGVFALSTQTGVISPDYSVFRKRSHGNMEYFEKVLKLPALRTELRIRSKGIVEGFWRLYTEDFFDIRLPTPPDDEQALIVEHLNEVTTEFEAAIARARRQIELMEEYRTRLIADVVTGKLDVREA